MALTFQYTAVKPGQKEKFTGTIQAENERQAREFLREKELCPIQIKALSSAEENLQKTFKKKQKSKAVLWLTEKLAFVGMKEKMLFTQNLALMLKAGIPITEVLMYMETYAENPKLRYMLNDVRKNILNGLGLSAALGKHHRIFDDVYVGIVRAGESSGELETVLDRLHGLLQTAQKLKKHVISALIYPVILVVLMALTCVVMFIFVIPTFTNIYNQMGVQLPLITQIMVQISNFFTQFWPLVIIGTGASIFGFMRFASTTSGKERLDSLTLKIPVFNTLVQYYSISNFIATLHVSFSSGLPITDCMYLATRTVMHTQIREALENVSYQIQSGQRFSASVAQTGLMPDMVLIMLSTGEESGELEKMLSQSLEFLESEVENRVEILMSLMEPLLLLVMGAVVLVMALTVYMPLFSMYENV